MIKASTLMRSFIFGIFLLVNYLFRTAQVIIQWPELYKACIIEYPADPPVLAPLVFLEGERVREVENGMWGCVWPAQRGQEWNEVQLSVPVTPAATSNTGQHFVYTVHKERVSGALVILTVISWVNYNKKKFRKFKFKVLSNNQRSSWCWTIFGHVWQSTFFVLLL